MDANSTSVFVSKNSVANAILGFIENMEAEAYISLQWEIRNGLDGLSSSGGGRKRFNRMLLILSMAQSEGAGDIGLSTADFRTIFRVPYVRWGIWRGWPE